MTTLRPRELDDATAVDEVGLLIANAGPRPAPATSAEDAVREAVEHAWSTDIDKRNSRRARRQLLAATLGVVIIGLSWTAIRHETAVNPTIVGALVAARGPVHVEPLAGGGMIVNGDLLGVGTSVETGPSGMALLTVAGAAIRLAPLTVLTLEQPGRVRLLRGQIYVDTGSSAAHVATLTVATPLADLTHLGTQFQVRLDPGPSMSVSVREGRVRLDGLRLAQTLVRGEGLGVGSNGEVTHWIVEPYDATWNWVNAFVPDFPMEGRPLSAFLDWFVRETGRTLVFLPPATRANTDQTTLNGSISGLTPVQALDAILATTRFNYDITVPGELRLGLRTTTDREHQTNATPATAPAVP